MALTYDLTTIPNYEERCYEQRDDGIYLHPVTEHLIWASMNTGIGSITLSNHEEVWRRLRIWSHVLDSRKPYVTAEDVHRHSSTDDTDAPIELADRELDARERRAS